MLASHIVGAFWYLLAVERNDTCWQRTCKGQLGCDTNYLYCGNQRMAGYDDWFKDGNSTLKTKCSAKGDDTEFDFGIYKNALSSGIVSSKKFISKYCYCLWWGLQNL
ncbi:probable cyclic nucleotide-gated ion channel 5, partial [Morus notabilis]